MALVTMNSKELNRLKIIQDVQSERMTPTAAAQVLGITKRQLRRLRSSYLKNGVPGLASSRRGRASNRSLPEFIKRDVVAIVRERYSDFGPTFARQKLTELHGITVGIETLRRWMTAEGLWADRKARQKPVYQPRYRRDCFGELVQIDGSLHWWFEDRGPQCTLLVFIDDATSRLLQLKFVESESAFSYFSATSEYLRQYGKPVAFYSDKHGVFRVNKKGAVCGDGMTQFGRALHELNIDIICANSPQAKGRVERANRTLQDRLVKELRLAGICSMDEANKTLPAYIADYNMRFSKAPLNDKDLHRLLTSEDMLDDVFVWREERTVSASLTLQYDKVVFMLEPNDITRGLVRKRVTISDYPDGRLIISSNGLPLAYSKFDKVRQVDQGAIVDNKRLSAVLTQIQAEQQQRPMHRSEAGPRRRSQENSPFRSGGSISQKKKARRAGRPTALNPKPRIQPMPQFVRDRLAEPVKQVLFPSLPPQYEVVTESQPQLSYEDELCMEIGRRVREEQAKANADRNLARFQSQRAYKRKLRETKADNDAEEQVAA